jgi:hypothetical protein
MRNENTSYWVSVFFLLVQGFFVLFLQRHWGIEHFDGEDVIWMGSLLQGGPYRSRGPVFGLVDAGRYGKPEG